MSQDSSSLQSPASAPDTNQLFGTDRLKVDLRMRTTRGGAVTMVSQGLKFVLGVGATVVLARLLTPQDYGLIGMVVVVTGFVSTFKDMGLSTATIQREEINAAQISTLFWINVALSVAIMLVTTALAPAVAWFYGERRLTLITIVYAAGFLFGGLTVQHEALLRRQMRFTALAVTEIVSLLAGIITAIVLGWYGARYWALVANQLVMGLSYAVAVWVVCRWRPGPPVRDPGVRSMLVFGRNMTGFSIVNYFARNLDNMLIGKFWGSQQLGLYAKAYQLLLLPIDQINSPIAAVAVPALSRLTDSPERYRRAYLRIIEKIAMLTMPGMALMIVTSDWIVRIVLGPNWMDASRIFALLGIVGLIQPILNTTGWLFISQGRTHHMFQWGLVGSTIIILSIIIGLPWGAMGVAFSYSVVGVCIIAPALFWFVGRVGPVTTGDFYRTIAPSGCASVCVLVTLFLFRRSGAVTDPVIGLGVALGMAAGITLAVLVALPAGRMALQDVWRLCADLTRRSKVGSVAGGPKRRNTPWTVSFVREWWSYMSLRSIMRLREYEVRNARGEQIEGETLELQLKSPVRGQVSLREVGSDILTFNEVIKEQVYKNISTHLKHCDKVIDLGANIGLASLYFANRYPTCRLFAVEPHPDTYRMLVHNLRELVDSGRCRTLRAAVWGSEKALVADLSHGSDHYSAFATQEGLGGENQEETMTGLPILKIIAESEFEKIDLLKIDIEGAEVELFKGESNWLNEVRAIAIEFHGDSRKASGFDRLMQEYRFIIYDSDPHTVLAIKEEASLGSA